MEKHWSDYLYVNELETSLYCSKILRGRWILKGANIVKILPSLNVQKYYGWEISYPFKEIEDIQHKLILHVNETTTKEFLSETIEIYGIFFTNKEVAPHFLSKWTFEELYEEEN